MERVGGRLPSSNWRDYVKEIEGMFVYSVYRLNYESCIV